MTKNIKCADNHKECVKVYDENNKWTGKKIDRKTAHDNKLFHREVALWVVDKSNNSILLQKRSKNKRYGAGKMGILAGHVTGNDSLLSTLQKEAKEELGLDISNYEVRRFLVYKKQEDDNYCFLYHYLIEGYVPIKEMDIQEEELSHAIYMDYDFVKARAKAFDPRFVIQWDEEHQLIFNELDKIFNK